MPWHRGAQSIEIELSRVQSELESKSEILDGRNGDKGMIRLFYEDRAKREQQSEDVDKLLKVVKVLMIWFGPPAVVGGVLSILRSFKVVP